MQYKFIRQTNSAKLCLFATGWGMDENPFINDIPAGDEDILICYDWSSFDFDIQLIQYYSEIRVIAWSLGVWATAYFLHQYPELYISNKTAINGTMFPINTQKGIAPNIFDATLQGLNHNSLNRFRKRMCMCDLDYNYFINHQPKRDIEDLRRELAIVASSYHQNINLSMHWDQVIISSNDKIFLPNKQLNAWKEQKVLVKIVDKAHFFRNMLAL